MTETVTVRMSRSDTHTAWGFQIQGGSDYNAPISIGAVQKGSLADRAGLHTGDVVSTLCGRGAQNMSHKEAQDTIVRNTTSVDLVVQRAGSGGQQRYWSSNKTSSSFSNTGGAHVSTQKYSHSAAAVPAQSYQQNSSQQYSSEYNSQGAGTIPAAPLKVETSSPINPGGTVYSQAPPKQPSPLPQVTVSLEDNRTVTNIPGFNRSPLPYAVRTQEVTTTTQKGGIKSTHDLQYNCPKDIYSDKATAEEYLRATGGCFGTDPSLFKPDPPPKGDIERSAVLALIREEEANRGRSPQPQRQPSPRRTINSDPYAAADVLLDESTGRVLFDRNMPSKKPYSDKALRKLRNKNGETIHSAIQKLEDAYHADYQRQSQDQHEFQQQQHVQQGGPVCDHCGRLIIGVFCNAGGKTLHADCFKCSTCGSSLKDIGFFNVAGKLYCEVHAAQRQANFGPRPPQGPETFLPRGYLPERPGRATTPPKAFYQPEILSRGPVHVPQPQPQGQTQRLITHTRQVNVGGGMSPQGMTPQSRGVPTHKVNQSFGGFQGAQHVQGSRATVQHMSSSSSYNQSSGGPDFISPQRSPSRANYVWPPITSSTHERHSNLPPSLHTGAGASGRSTSVPLSPPSQVVPHWSHSALTSPGSIISALGDPDHSNLPYWALAAVPHSFRSKSSTPVTYEYEQHLKTPTTDFDVHLNNSNVALDAYQARINQLRHELRRKRQTSTGASSTHSSVSQNNDHGLGVSTPSAPNTTPATPQRPFAQPPFLDIPSVDARFVLPEIRNLADDSGDYADNDSQSDPIGSTAQLSTASGPVTPPSTHSSSVTHSPPIPPEDYNYLSTISEERSSIEDLRPSPLPPTSLAKSPLAKIISLEDGQGADTSSGQETVYRNIPRPASQEKLLRISDSEPEQKESDKAKLTMNTNGGDKTDPDVIKDGLAPADPMALLDSPEFAAFAEQMTKGAIADATYTVDLEQTLINMQNLAAEFEEESQKLEEMILEEQRFYEQRRQEEEYEVDEALLKAEELLNIVQAQEKEQKKQKKKIDGEMENEEDAYPVGLQNQTYSAPPPAPAPVFAPAPVPAPAPAPVFAPAPAPAPAPFSAPAPPKASAPLGGGSSGSASSAPLRGRGVLKQLSDLPRTPYCQECRKEIRGPFILAMNKTWCPEHFVCAGSGCGRKLLDVGFVEEQGRIYCEYCFEQHFAPKCAACQKAVTGDCLNALDKQWHPDCFCCAHCHQPFGNSSFFLEDGKPYCERDWNSMFTTKCVSCKFPIEAGDRWVEALGGAYHSDCFVCSYCHCNLEGQSFYAKGGHPYCKAHA